MVISTTHSYKKSPIFLTYLLAFYCTLSISGCATVDLGNHDVSPEVQADIETPYTKIVVTVSDDVVVNTPLLHALNDEGIEVEFIDSATCFGNSHGEARTQISLDQLLQSDSMEKANACGINYVVVVGEENYIKNQTDLAATIVNIKETDKSETLHIHAEGNIRGFLPAPVPYLSLFYFVSTPDTEGSAMDALAEAIVKKIEMETNDRPVRLLYLKSGDLPYVARQIAQQAKSREGKNISASDTELDITVSDDDADDDSEMSRYNPLYFYVQMNKEAAEEGSPAVHSPLGQLQLLLTSILATPGFIIFDAINSPDQSTGAKESPDRNVSPPWELYNKSKRRGIHNFKWLCAAAEQGDYRARWELGHIYFKGLYGVRKDLVQSVMWYSLVEADGHNPTSVDDIRTQLTPEQLTEAEHLYENWKSGQCEREISGTVTNNTN